MDSDCAGAIIFLAIIFKFMVGFTCGEISKGVWGCGDLTLLNVFGSLRNQGPSQLDKPVRLLISF